MVVEFYYLPTQIKFLLAQLENSVSECSLTVPDNALTVMSIARAWKTHDHKMLRLSDYDYSLVRERVGEILNDYKTKCKCYEV